MFCGMGSDFCLRLRLLLRSLLLRGRAALLLRLRRGLLVLRRVMPALLLLLSPRRRLREGRSRLEQINCRERRTANDEPHSRFHVRLFRLIRASDAGPILCLQALYRPGSLVNVGVSTGNINPRATIFPMSR